MNILVFSIAFYPAIGGIENQTLILLDEFVKDGHNVKVITSQKQYAPLEDIEIFERPNILQSIKLYFWCNALFMPNISLRGVWMFLLNPFKKWIISHNDFYLIDKVSFSTRLKFFFMRFASHNIAVSKSVAKHIPIKSTVIYNCYDDSVFQLYPEEERVYDFVFLGRLVSQKGCELLINACKEIRYPFTLNIIGDGPEKEKLQQLVRDLGLSKQIKFKGFLKGIGLAKMLNRHRVMVIPSVDGEGFGIVALEGMACGCEIIAANAGGLSEAVSNYGRKFKMGDQRQLTKLMNNSFNFISRDEAVSNDKKEYLDNHSKGVVAKRYLQYFSKV